MPAWTLLRDNVCRLKGVMNWAPSLVSTTFTSKDEAFSALTISHALYAAMLPVTPNTAVLAIISLLLIYTPLSR